MFTDMNSAAIDIVEIAAIVVAGTMTGNEIAVAVFFHPRISRLEDAVHIRAAQAFGGRPRRSDAVLVCARVSVKPRSHFRRPPDVEHAVVAGARFGCASRHYDHIHFALARAH